MNATMTKKVSIGIMFAMILTILMTFAMPIVSHANDIGAVSIKVDDDGNLTIGGKTGFTDAGSTDAWNDLLKKYRTFIVGFSGIGAVSMIAFFIMSFIKLGASVGNPQARAQALGAVLWTGIAAAGLGAVTIIVGFFYNAIS